jgi:hypothetical protein
MFHRRLDGFDFYAPSIHIKNAKYDAYDAKTGKYINSFGHTSYQQYKDRIGAFSHLDHLDKDRRRLYLSRHKNDYNELPHASFFARKYLW